jgi:hypothetical protein
MSAAQFEAAFPNENALVDRLSDVPLIKLNDAAELVHGAFHQRGANAMAHIPGGYEGTKAKLVLNLKSTDATTSK